MKKLLFIIFCISSLFSFAQSGINTAWTWKKGDNTTNQAGVYGTQGVPDILNNPRARNSAVCWTDASGNFWLFGGNSPAGSLNDLWKYTLATNEWTWMKGSSLGNQFGTYGVQGVPAPANTPGARAYAMEWVDDNGNLWLYGGQGYGSSSNGRLNDLWKYDPVTNQWTFMKGNTVPDVVPTYGTQGVPAFTNSPGGRWASVTWKDASGDLWMFGGEGSITISLAGKTNQLWKYNLASNQWTWVKGSNAIVNPTGVYGTQGVANAANNPGSRSIPVSWVDNFGNPWIFGGYGYSASGSTSEELNDLWKYNSSTNEWTWMKGDNMGNPAGVYGTQGVADNLNKPGGRDSHGAWKDSQGNFWIFDGYGVDGLHNDLWKYEIATNNWIWFKGNNSINQLGVYGTLGIPDVNNRPGSRYVFLSWTDNANNFWLFGGRGYATSGGQGNLSDLWKISNAALLPLTLLSFNGSVINDHNLLYWQTTVEINTSGFIIERGADGRNFISIGYINGPGNSSVIKDYSFADKDPMPGINFYRLKMVDIDGRSAYSRIISIKQIPGETGLSLFPNPVKDVLFVQVKGVKGNAVLEITDVSGRKIKENHLQLNENTSFSVNSSDLPKGTYLLLIKSSAKTFQ
ncbi:MAG TPA: kelch repeat-containing protein, partial [Ferruginibacter sp.]|nr:kelch repeat-containing protein [Ferruginibacter sp.]